MRFSERRGLTPARQALGLTDMPEALRNSLWNALTIAIIDRPHFMEGSLHASPEIKTLFEELYINQFRQPLDRMPSGSTNMLRELRERFFSGGWNEVYDLLEGILEFSPETEKLVKTLNLALKQELAAFRVIDLQFVDITAEEEVAALEEALQDTRFAGVASHLGRAMELLTDRKNPDYRNSIKESISAVESIARIVSGNAKATLGDALKVLEANGKLHKALRDGFLKLYGYTSDEDGIRHAMMDEPDLSAFDAKYFLLSCTSFVNYLKAQL